MPPLARARQGRTGGQILIDALLGHGVQLAFGVPGESYLGTLDALHDVRDRLRFIVCRHEAAAANMAEAHAKLTGKPGVCFVSRGPGACHAAIGLHTAFQDSTPLVLFIGQVRRGVADREALQEIDYRRMLAPLAKWVGQIDDAARIPELVSRAFHLAMAGRPGPVVLAIPEDMQREMADVADLGPYNLVQANPGAADMHRLRALLATVERPLMIVGGGGWSAAAAADITRFARLNNLPVAASFRCQDIVDNTQPIYAGDLGSGPNPALVVRAQQADLLLVVGARLGEMTTQGYSFLAPPRLKQTLAHVHADSGELGRVFYPDLPINAGMAEFAAAAVAMAPVAHGAWDAWTAAARRDYEATLAPGSSPGPLDMNVVMAALHERLPPDTIVAIDAGNFSGWPQRYWRFRAYRGQLAPTSGAMGYGVPAAVAAALAQPARRVIAFVGDGGFQMSGQELATALQYGAKPLILVVNNRMYGTIRMHQESEYPGRAVATDLQNPDFAAYARAFGAFGAAVERTGEFAPALAAALAADRAAVIELRLDPEVITTRKTLADIKQAGAAQTKGSSKPRPR
jgi:acetolactate synthase I/II/III large subunit